MKSLLPTNQAIRVCQLAVLLAFVITLGLSLFLPVYSDEVSWKFMQARLLIDGGVNITLYPYCGASFALVPPWFMVPARLFDAWLYADLAPPIRLRLLGIIHLLIWVTLLLWLLPKTLALQLQRVTLMSVIIAFITLGVLPFLLIINRPEQVLLLGLTVIFLLPFLVGSNRSIWLECGRALFLVLIAAVLFSYHPKAFPFLPLIIISSYFSVRHWMLRIPAGGALSYFVVSSYVYWSERMACPEHMEMMATLRKYGGFITLSDILSEPGKTVQIIIHNVFRVIQYPYSMFFLPQENVEARWMPANDSLSIWALLTNVFLLIFGILSCILFLYILYFLRQRLGTNHGNRQRFGMTVAVIISILLLSGLEPHKNFYDTSLIVPLAALAILMSIPIEFLELYPVAMRRLTGSLIGLSLFSQIVLWIGFAPFIQTSLEAEPYISRQWGSFSALQYAHTRASILETANLCRIPESSTTQYLVVDDLTYTVFAGTYRPFHLTYLVRDLVRQNGEDVSLLVGFLRQKESAGIIGGCHSFPKGLSDQVIRNGDFCCLPPFSPKV